jgi:hypothetical protein
VAIDQHNLDENPEKLESGSTTRRDLVRKAAYIAPAVLAVIAAADRPALAGSGIGIQ